MRAQRCFCVAFLQMFPVSWQLARSTSSPALEKADVSWFFRQLLVEPKKQNQSELQRNKKAARAISSERFVSCFSILKDSTFFQRRNLDRETDALTRDAGDATICRKQVSFQGHVFLKKDFFRSKKTWGLQQRTFLNKGLNQWNKFMSLVLNSERILDPKCYQYLNHKVIWNHNFQLKKTSLEENQEILAMQLLVVTQEVLLKCLLGLPQLNAAPSKTFFHHRHLLPTH